MSAPLTQTPTRLSSPSGLSVTINANGSIGRLEHGDVLLNLFPGSELEGGPANLYIRVNGVAAPLLGPRSASAFKIDANTFIASGEWHGVRYVASLVLADSMPAWYWHITLQVVSIDAAIIDLYYAQDVGLTSYWGARNNEYYVSQYVDHTPLEHRKHGVVVASRQNQPLNGKHPWCVIGSLSRADSYATDALQVHGLASRAGKLPAGIAQGLPGERLQHEHSMPAIQDEPLRLEPGEKATRGFFGGFSPHHADATSDADLRFVDQVLAQPQAGGKLDTHQAAIERRNTASLFTAAPLLESLELSESEIGKTFGTSLREIERDSKGTCLSFFTGDHTHVVMKAKELAVLRPHGHMLRTGAELTPDEAALTSTTWMNGVFNSLVTQGHVGINRLISTARSYLGLFRAHGQRVFVEIDGVWKLLDVPSAFVISPSECRWIYKHAGGTIEVQSVARSSVICLRIDIKAGPATRFLISTHVAVNGDDGAIGQPVQFSRTDEGVFIRTVADTDIGNRFPDGGFALKVMKETQIQDVGGDELLFIDQRSRHQPYVCMITAPSTWAGIKIVGNLLPQGSTAELDPEHFWDDMSGGLRAHPPGDVPLGSDVSRLAEMMPWFAHNALVHYLSPRGLEQFSGGGWGSRDVTQGPVEMLLSLGRTEPVRDLLIRVFKQQNADGDWPQWFMFFDRERNIRPGDSHGDIVFWPLLALAQYLLASGDGAFLESFTPFFDPEGEANGTHASILAHVDRALKLIAGRVIPNTHLAAYGHGDWNDSLQPADPSMRERLCSAWTVTLHYQTLTTLAEAFERLGHAARSVSLRSQALNVLNDFQRLLIVDDVITGYAYFHEEGRTDYLLHPRDTQSGVKYSALPMIHAIANGMLTPAQAEHHLKLIDDHLLAPDGVRLFDRPLPYRGGLMKFFQRAETATFFGREIGLMYTHAHLRYIEALARHGDAEKFFDQLCRANPIAIQSRVPTATMRQSNTYYSSSDAVFKDRYQAFDDYARAMKGEIAYEGGWRIYSSGAGISMAMILRCMLGFRREAAKLVIDPVLPSSLNGLRVELNLVGKPFEVVYHVGSVGCVVNAIKLNGQSLPFTREANPYRAGGAEVGMDLLRGQLIDGGHESGVWRLDVTIG